MATKRQRREKEARERRQEREAAPPTPRAVGPRAAPVRTLRLHSDADAPELTIEPRRYGRAVALARREGSVMPMTNSWTYKVRSTSTGGSYIVEEKRGLWECDCQDFSFIRPCQHVLAVLLRRGILPFPDEEAEEPEHAGPESGAFDWVAYRKAELALPTALPRLAFRLFEMLPQPPPRMGPGRPPIPQTDTFLSALLWATNQKNMRREQDTRDRWTNAGLISRTIDPTAISRTLNDERTAPLLEEALRRTREAFGGLDDDASPLTLSVLGDTLAVDSTGFTPSRRGHYNREKHGPTGPIPWLKCHLMISTKARLITSARITANMGKGVGDTSYFDPLLRETAEAFPIRNVVGDGAYAHRKNVGLVTELGGRAYFPPRDDANLKEYGYPGWAKMATLFKENQEAFNAIYHRRSVVEAVNSAIKRRFGETLRGRTAESRKNELLCKLIAYNLTVIVQNLHYLHVEDAWLDQIL